MRVRIQPTLATLNQQILAVGLFWHPDPKRNRCLSLFLVGEERGSKVYWRVPVIPGSGKYWLTD